MIAKNINEGLYAIRKNTRCRVYSLIVTKDQYELLINNIDKVSKDRKKYDYDIKALFYRSLDKLEKREYKYVCSNFVGDMLYKSNINIINKPPHHVMPNDFYDKEELTLEYEGLLSEYKTRNTTFVPNMVSI